MRQILIFFIMIFATPQVHCQTEEEMFKMLNDTLKKDPKNSEMLFFRAIGFGVSKKYDSSIIDFTAALKYLPEFKSSGKAKADFNNGMPLDSIHIIHNRAWCYYIVDSLTKSISDYRYLQTQKPNEYFYSVAVVRLYMARKLFDLAQIEIDNIKKEKGNLERALVQQSILYYEQSNFQKSLKAIDEALEKFPFSIEGLKFKGKILVKLSRQQESCKYFDEALTKMTLEYFSGEYGYQHDFKDDLENLKKMYCE